MSCKLVFSYFTLKQMKNKMIVKERKEKQRHAREKYK